MLTLATEACQHCAWVESAQAAMHGDAGVTSCVHESLVVLAFFAKISRALDASIFSFVLAVATHLVTAASTMLRFHTSWAM